MLGKKVAQAYSVEAYLVLDALGSYCTVSTDVLLVFIYVTEVRSNHDLICADTWRRTQVL